MSDKYFLDTNIFVYSFDKNNPEKCGQAQELICNALDSGKGVISYQVVQEFLCVALKKFTNPLSITDAAEYLSSVLFPLCQVYPGTAFYLNALEIRERTRLSLYDSLIVQAAREAGCRTLFSEDMQHGFKYFELTVKNPFSIL